MAYDRRGRGRSEDGAAYALEREVEDLHAVLRHVGEPAHLVGHSFGARVCLAAAPEAELRSLTLYEPPIALDRTDSSVIARAKAAHDVQDWEGVLEAFQPAADMTPEEISFCKSVPSLRAAQREAARTLLRELEAIRHRPEAPGPLPFPVYVLIGELSTMPVYLDGLERLVDGLKATRLTLAGQRHVAMAADPQTFAAVLSQAWGPVQ